MARELSGNMKIWLAAIRFSTGGVFVRTYPNLSDAERWVWRYKKPGNRVVIQQVEVGI